MKKAIYIYILIRNVVLYQKTCFVSQMEACFDAHLIN